jgi:Endodeoxyribonuclease RusA.
VIVVTIPAPVQFLNANDRLSWQKRARLTKQWREAAIVWARHDKLPKNLGPIKVDAHLHFTQTRRRDAANWSPTVKACIDGLVDYGLIADDDDSHLQGPFLYIGGRSLFPIGDVALAITEVDGQ